MITVTIEQKTGAVSRRLNVSAASIERALEIAGNPTTQARVVFPIDGHAFFAPVTAEGIDYEAMSPEEIADAREADLPGACNAWIDVLKDDLGERNSRPTPWRTA